MTQLMLEPEWTALQAREAARTAGAFLDAAGTATGRATFYNTKEEQARAEARVHDKLLALHRGLYALLATLPGVTDHTRMRVVSKLLGTPGGNAGERAILEFLVSSLPAPRRFRLFDALRRARVNNARTRRIILRTILDSPKLELWSAGRISWEKTIRMTWRIVSVALMR